MQKEKIVVVIRERGYLGIADGARRGHREFIYCTNTRDSKALKEEVLRYLRSVFGINPTRFEIVIRDARH